MREREREREIQRQRQTPCGGEREKRAGNIQYLLYGGVEIRREIWGDIEGEYSVLCFLSSTGFFESTLSVCFYAPAAFQT